MDGDIALVDDILQLTKEENAWLMIDESHAIGVLGENGKGTQSHFAVKQQAEILTGSLGKAMGGIGGYAAGSEKLMNLIEICCRPFIFSTSIPGSIAAQITESIRLLETDLSIRKKLWHNITYFKTQIKNIGFNTGHTASAIIPVIIPDEVKLLNFCRFLHDNYVFVNPIFYPVVSKRKSRLRISITALLGKEELDHALDTIETAAHHFQII
jgi:glycine C-acetyltransferase